MAKKAVAKMKTKLLIAVLLLLCATMALAGPSYINEARKALTSQMVSADARFTALAVQFGRSGADLVGGQVCNLPVGSSGKFRWGRSTWDAAAWPATTAEESAVMPGVLYDLGGGWFLHAQLGEGGNAMMFYGQLLLPQKGDTGPQGPPGNNGTNGRDGQDAAVQPEPEQPQPVLEANSQGTEPRCQQPQPPPRTYFYTAGTPFRESCLTQPSQLVVVPKRDWLDVALGLINAATGFVSAGKSATTILSATANAGGGNATGGNATNTATGGTGIGNGAASSSSSSSSSAATPTSATSGSTGASGAAGGSGPATTGVPTSGQ
jgi:hypothetical protein